MKRQKRKAKEQKMKAAALLLGRLNALRKTQDPGADVARESDVLPFKDVRCPVPEAWIDLQP